MHVTALRRASTSLVAPLAVLLTATIGRRRVPAAEPELAG